MKNDKKKIGFSPTKKIFSAAAMLAVSASMLATSTYAWFSMNTQVTATGMQVKAQAEGGIVISNSDKATWNANATAKNGGVAALVPTSTANATNWYHAVSDDANDAKKAQSATGAYTSLSVTENSGVGNAVIGSTTSAIYLVNTFYIKSSAEAVTLGDSGLYINSVDVTLPQTQATAQLNEALRVAVSVKSGDKTATSIFAPVAGGDTSYKVNNATDVTAIAANTKNTSLSDIKSVPAYSSESPIEAKIWVYFEGEDEECKSANLAANTDNITVSVTFGTSTVATS